MAKLTDETRETAKLMIGEGYSSFTSDLVKLYNEEQEMEMDAYISKLYLADARRKLALGGHNRREIMDSLGHLDIPFHIAYSNGFLATRKVRKEK